MADPKNVIVEIKNGLADVRQQMNLLKQDTAGWVSSLSSGVTRLSGAGGGGAGGGSSTLVAPNPKFTPPTSQGGGSAMVPYQPMGGNIVANTPPMGGGGSGGGGAGGNAGGGSGGGEWVPDENSPSTMTGSYTLEMADSEDIMENIWTFLGNFLEEIK
jgi:hypothetical protein